MLAIEWTEPALADLIEIETFIASENPRAAKVIGQRIWDASQSIGDYPFKGRMGYVEGTREWVVDKTPCILVYRVNERQIEIVHVHHDRTNWKT